MLSTPAEAGGTISKNQVPHFKTQTSKLSMVVYATL